MAPLRLFVFVRGLRHPLESITIDIEWSKTVGDLKEAIFPKIIHSLEHKIDASALSLYKVEFLDALDVGDLEELAFKAKKEKLLASLKLSSAFTASPPELTISILAELPPYGTEEQDPVTPLYKQLAVSIIGNQNVVLTIVHSLVTSQMMNLQRKDST